MKQIVQLQNAQGKTFFRMSYNDQLNYLYSEWFGYIVHQEVLDGGQQQMEWASANARLRKCDAAVNDNRKLRGSWDGAIEWIDRTWNHAMYDAGVRYNAIVISPDLFTQVSAENLVATNRPGSVTHRLVPSLQVAESWLTQTRREPGGG